MHHSIAKKAKSVFLRIFQLSKEIMSCHYNCRANLTTTTMSLAVELEVYTVFYKSIITI